MTKTIEAAIKTVIDGGTSPLLVKEGNTITFLGQFEGQLDELCNLLVRLSTNFDLTFKQEFKSRVVLCSPHFAKLSNASTLLRVQYYGPDVAETRSRPTKPSTSTRPTWTR